MLQIYHMAIEHVVDARDEVFAALVVARELLRKSDERLVVGVEGSWFIMCESSF